MTVYSLLWVAFVIAGVLFMVADHRRGWLTEALVDGLRYFHSPRLDSSGRADRRADRHDE